MKYRSVFSLLVIGVLTLTVLYLYADRNMVRKEYTEYRDGIFARSYETLLADLSTYLEEEDGTLCSRITAGLSSLPLSDREVDTMRRFAEDMAAGLYDETAKTRALTYGEMLFRHLSGNRSRSYEDRWRASALGLPDYPEESREVAAIPEEDAGSLLREERVKRLLGRGRTLSYQRQGQGVVLYGYRTASSYVEMTETGRPVRYLRFALDDTPYDGEGAEESAHAFLKEFQWEKATVSEGERRDNAVIFSLVCDGKDGVIGVGSDGVFLFRMGEE